MLFLILISFVILQRVTELTIAKQNEKWLLRKGAVEYGQKHYPFLVAMHTLFILSLIYEYSGTSEPRTSYLFLFLYILLLALKIWTIASLGRFWNTKILRIPGMHFIKRGPYKFLRHPNYLIVIAEIAVIPLTFHLYYTAVIFSLLNAAMLMIRIKEENNAWQ